MKNNLEKCVDLARLPAYGNLVIVNLEDKIKVHFTTTVQGWGHAMFEKTGATLEEACGSLLQAVREFCDASKDTLA